MRGGGAPGGSSSRVETAQRQLELRRKKMTIQIQQKKRLDEMVQAIRSALVGGRSVSQMHWLAGKLETIRLKPKRMDVVLESLEKGAAREALPHVLACMKSGRKDVRERVRQTLVGWTGVDHGTSHAQWSRWWNKR